MPDGRHASGRALIRIMDAGGNPQYWSGAAPLLQTLPDAAPTRRNLHFSRVNDFNFQENNVKRFLTCMAASLALLLGVASAQDSAKQDMKDAGHETKQAAKDTGHATKKTAKKAGHNVKKGAHKAAHKTEEGAQKVEDKTAPQ